jgi:SAM-dependent methyltransferase
VHNLFKSYLGKGAAWLTSPIGSKKLARILFFFINHLSTSRTPSESLVFLLELERYLFTLTGTESCRYGQGVHSKHRHTHYHDFFTQKIRPGEKVLDIGCGNGALSYDMARSGAQVVGMDRVPEHIAKAQKDFFLPNLEFIHGDSLKDLPAGRFDIITLSNVLEHIQDRIGFIRKLQKVYNPARWLLRVPAYERDWRVPLMEELGVDYRQDDSHFIEYKREQWIQELHRAGLNIRSIDFYWGEIWCEAVAGEQGEEP